MYAEGLCLLPLSLNVRFPHRSGAHRERVPVGIGKLGAHHLRDGQAASLRPLLDGLAQALKPNGPAQGGANALIERDANTGKAYLKLPMPSPQTVDKIMSFLRGLNAGT